MPGRIMAIAAHPGDGLFTMGATVARQIERGGAGTFLSLSLGERGAPKNIPIRQYGEMQRAATEKASRLLGAGSIILPYPDAEIPFNDESTMRVCDAIREHKPDVIVTHWNGSWHKDHQNCHLVVHDAIFYAALDTLERKLPAHSVARTYYAENWEDATNFQPDTYLETSTRCGAGRPVFSGITITMPAWRSCEDAFPVFNTRSRLWRTPVSGHRSWSRCKRAPPLFLAG